MAPFGRCPEFRVKSEVGVHHRKVEGAKCPRQGAPCTLDPPCHT